MEGRQFIMLTAILTEAYCFCLFWKGHNVALYEEYQVSENLSYIPTLRDSNCNLCRSILPCFLCCNALHPISSAYLLHLVRCPAQFAVFSCSSCSCLDVNMLQNSKLWGALDKVCQIRAQDWVQSVTTQETGQANPEERTLSIEP